jgi:hypothetical protein
MAVKPPNTQVQSNLNLPNRRQGSGFVGFERTAEQNRQQSQQLGQQIGTGVQQQVQGVQQQAQGTIQGQQNLVGTEQQRLGQAEQVKQQIGTSPSDVNRDQYQDLTSGRVQTANVGAVQQLQGSLGQTAQQAQGLVRDPSARLSAIRQFANQPLATQDMSTAQRGLDATLLGRNVDLQGLAQQTARQSFGLDRTLGTAAEQLGQSNEDLRRQAMEAQTGLRTARQDALTGEYSAAERAQQEYDATIGSFLRNLNASNILEALGANEGPKRDFMLEGAPQVKVGNEFVDVPGQPTSTTNAFRDRLFSLLEEQGIDARNLDITDIGLTAAADKIRSGISGREAITREEALTNEQRARLKALYGLEGEGADRDYLNQEAQEFNLSSDLSKLRDAGTASAAASAAAKQKYDQAIATIRPNMEETIKRNLNFVGAERSSKVGQRSPAFDGRAIINESFPELKQQAEALAKQRSGGKQITESMLSQAYADVAAPFKDQIVNKAVQKELSILESAARSGNFRSMDVDRIGEMYYKGPQFGTNSGWARAMAEVQNAFAPYVTRKVQTLAGGQRSPDLVGGANVSTAAAASGSSGKKGPFNLF